MRWVIRAEKVGLYSDDLRTHVQPAAIAPTKDKNDRANG